MVKPLHPQALFRLTVLGPLASREQLASGELKTILLGLAKETYKTPEGKVVRYSAKAIERWYYLWCRNGIDGLAPKERNDSGSSAITNPVAEKLLHAKREKPSRSITTLIHLMEHQGWVGTGQLSRSGVHRLLVRHQLSKRTVSDSHQIERRSFETQHAGDIWYGDVMHGPKITTSTGLQKTYLVSWMDDASRLVCHSGFYLAETAIAVEHALKEAILKRGLPKKIVIDNGAAYRAETLQHICARLEIQLIYCRPYEPEAKGKLERWHRTLRESFLSELSASISKLRGLDELNAKLWVWLEHYYHQQVHSGLGNELTPLQRWQQDLTQVRPLGALAQQLDDYFYHRIKRCIRKDGTLSYEGKRYEVPHAYVQQTIYLVIEPHAGKALWIESMKYEKLSDVHPLDKYANFSRQRQRPELAPDKSNLTHETENLVDVLYEKAQQAYDITNTTTIKNNEER